MSELRFRLSDGEQVVTTDGRELFDALWLAVERRGAISAAGKVAHVRALAPPLRGVVELDEQESERLREALARVARNAPSD